MKIGIIDADLMDNGTRHPNLALMKISGYLKEKGNEVELIYNSYDQIKTGKYKKVYISKVFSFTKVPNLKVYKNVKFIKGGTGFFEDGGKDLEVETEHHMPDYSLYNDYVEHKIKLGQKREKYSDYLDYSIGFATRGCFRKCSFCVNKKYDHVFRHAKISEFYDPTRKRIYLWDDNFLAYPQWEEVLDELEETKKSFQFRQGIDLRLMTDRIAYRFNKTRWHGDFIFAFDHLTDRDIIIKNVQLWKKYTNKNPKMYVLSAYESQDEVNIADVFERIKILMKYGAIPYIMRYEAYKHSRWKGMYIQLARWCNQPQFLKKMSFRQFCVRNQFYHPNKETDCSSYAVMREFENEFPEIAEEYFDLRYEDRNIYKVNYGFGHKYFNKCSCNECKKKDFDWDYLLNCNSNTLSLYFDNEINVRCLKYSNAECESNLESVVNIILENLRESTIAECENALLSYNKSFDLQKKDYIMPTRNEKEYVTILRNIFLGREKDVVISDVWKNDEFRNIASNDDLRILAMLDLIYLSTTNTKAVIELSPIGEAILLLKEDIQEDIVKKLMYRIPLIAKFIRLNKDINELRGQTNKEYLNRRMINYLLEHYAYERLEF